MWLLHFARRYVDIVPDYEGKSNAVTVASEEVDDARADLEEAKEAHRLLADRRDFPEADRTAREVWEDVKTKRERSEQERAVHFLSAKRDRQPTSESCERSGGLGRDVGRGG